MKTVSKKASSSTGKYPAYETRINSLGAARIAGHLAAMMSEAGRLDGPAARAALAARARHRGPEQKHG